MLTGSDDRSVASWCSTGRAAVMSGLSVLGSRTNGSSKRSVWTLNERERRHEVEIASRTAPVRRSSTAPSSLRNRSRAWATGTRDWSVGLGFTGTVTPYCDVGLIPGAVYRTRNVHGRERTGVFCRVRAGQRRIRACGSGPVAIHAENNLRSRPAPVAAAATTSPPGFLRGRTSRCWRAAPSPRRDHRSRALRSLPGASGPPRRPRSRW